MRLATAIPQPRCELDHRDAWTLLIATILSAQSTDRTVNSVTPLLFSKWPTPETLAAAPREEVETVVHRTGFFRNKAKAIQGASLAIHTQHGGKVPTDMAALMQLPGVARKTANVVLGVAFRIPAGIVVDTHVMRTSQRLGLTAAAAAEKVERSSARCSRRTSGSTSATASCCSAATSAWPRGRGARTARCSSFAHRGRARRSAPGSSVLRTRHRSCRTAAAGCRRRPSDGSPRPAPAHSKWAWRAMRLRMMSMRSI